MLERGANSWFYSRETRTQGEKEKRNQRLAEILMRYKEQMLKDFRLARVLPYLVYDGVFSIREYREILSQDRYPERVERFFLKLFSKGPSAFCAFCAHLEELSPYLLASIFLYYQEQTQRILPDVPVAEEAEWTGAQWDSSTVSDPQDQEQRARLFNRRPCSLQTSCQCSLNLTLGSLQCQKTCSSWNWLAGPGAALHAEQDILQALSKR